MKIAVFGAGTMGSGIAQVFAGKGHTVLLYASSKESAQRHKDKLEKSLQKRVAKGKMAEDAMKSGNIPANPRQSTVRDIIKLYEKTM